MKRQRPRVDSLRRGDIVWVDCDPSIGVEPRKTRCCVVVSNDIANEFGQAVTVVPTQQFTKERAERSFIVDLRKSRSTLKESRVANCSMIMTYDRQRVVAREGRAHESAMQGIEKAIKLHLGISEDQA